MSLCGALSSSSSPGRSRSRVEKRAASFGRFESRSLSQGVPFLRRSGSLEHGGQNGPGALSEGHASASASRRSRRVARTRRAVCVRHRSRPRSDLQSPTPSEPARNGPVRGLGARGRPTDVMGRRCRRPSRPGLPAAQPARGGGCEAALLSWNALPPR